MILLLFDDLCFGVSQVYDWMRFYFKQINLNKIFIRQGVFNFEFLIFGLQFIGRLRVKFCL